MNKETGSFGYAGIISHNGEELEFEVDISFTASTWSESRGEHFGTPCSEDMGEIEIDSHEITSLKNSANQDVEITSEIEKLIETYLDKNEDDLIDKAWETI